MKLYVRFSETHSGGEPEDPNDRWTYHAPSYTDHTTKYISATEITGWDVMTFHSSIDFEPGDIAYVVRVTYSTGSTFGRNHGKTEYVDAYSDPEKAFVTVASIKTDCYKSTEGYVAWKGYFEELESVEILTVKLK